MTAGLLLAADQVELYPPGEPDAHGWVLPGTDRYWAGSGNLQLQPGLSDPRAADRGGHGPYDPAAVQAGVLYLPPPVPLVEGSLAVVEGRGAFVLSQIRIMPDPADPGGGIACWAATATAVPGEDGPGEDQDGEDQDGEDEPDEDQDGEPEPHPGPEAEPW